MPDGTEKTVFATVGTTKFDLFICTLTHADVLEALRYQGYKNLIIQKGCGKELPNEENAVHADINLTFYDYKNSINEDILKADLVISHAGAGTCLEVLKENKPLLVVINEELMHNHQIELANQLSTDGYVLACTCSNLCDTIKHMNVSILKKMPPPQPMLFANFLNKFMGFQKKD